MKINNSMAVFILLASLIGSLSQAQTVPTSSYTLLANYATNPYFQVINQTLQRSYSSYLAQTSISSVYLYSSDSLVSMIITYANKSGALYRGIANYLPSTRQLSVQSFGPVATQQNTAGAHSTPQVTVYEQQNGIGITAASSPPNTANNLVPGTNPSLRNQQISVLLPNSTTTAKSTRSTTGSQSDDDYNSDSSRSSSTYSSSGYGSSSSNYGSSSSQYSLSSRSRSY